MRKSCWQLTCAAPAREQEHRSVTVPHTLGTAAASSSSSSWCLTSNGQFGLTPRPCIARFAVCLLTKKCHFENSGLGEFLSVRVSMHHIDEAGDRSVLSLGWIVYTCHCLTVSGRQKSLLCTVWLKGLLASMTQRLKKEERERDTGIADFRENMFSGTVLSPISVYWMPFPSHA